MRTLILSDLHFGNGKGFDIFAGSTALPALLGTYIRGDSRIILAGDSVDFLMNEDPLHLDVPRAVSQAVDIAHNKQTQETFRALGAVLAAGGQVIVRLGNHDVELCLPPVQAIFREALGQPPAVAERLEFQLGNTPLVIEENGARVLISHGEHNDIWNRVNYDQLLRDGTVLEAVSGFEYPPGSRLVKTLMNPLKREYRMRFADLLKPDIRGAALTALAVDPSAVKTLFKASTATLLWQLFRRSGGAMTFAPGEGEPDLGLSERVEGAGLDEAEILALHGLLAEEGLVSFAPDDAGALDSALFKLGRAGLLVYAGAQRLLSGKDGEQYFERQPTSTEWTEARRLSEKFKVQAVVLGHTHAARFRAEQDLTYINTGTWIWLMSLPPNEASEQEWANFLSLLRENPSLDPTRGKAPPLKTRFTAATLDPAPKGGATLALVEWTDRNTLDILASTLLRPQGG